MLNQYATGELKRFAAHPQAPKNTASWLISRSLQWCELEGYSALRSYAGIAANEGTIYQALGFEPIEADADEGDDQLTLSASADEQTTPALSDGGTTVPEANMVDASGWANSREGRVEMESYLQRRYEYRFTEADRVRRPEPQPLSASSGPESASLADYGVVDKSGYTPSDDLLTGDVSDVTQTHPDCLFERWDTRPRAVASALVRYGDQTATEATDPLWDATDEGDVEAAFEAAFAAATADGIAAVVVVDEPDEQGRWDFGTLEITGYAAVETGHPSNMAATLLARVRDWAGLQGYSTVRGTAQPGSTLHEALGQAGFDCQRRADHIVATADS